VAGQLAASQEGLSSVSKCSRTYYSSGFHLFLRLLSFVVKDSGILFRLLELPVAYKTNSKVLKQMQRYYTFP
jgi:hypothetical protein